MRHDEATAAPPNPPRPPEHAGEDDSASLHFGMPPVVKRRRRGSVGVIMICGLAIVSGALAYALGQVDVKPVEVVQIIPLPGPLPEPVSSKDAGEAGASAPASEMTTPSPAPETAPSPQSAEPVPEDVDPPSRGAEPMPQAVDPEPVPQGVDPEADFATQVPQPAPSQDDAALEVQSEAAEAAAAAETVEETAAETASQGESAQAARLPADEAREEEPAEVSSRLRIDEDGDGASASAADGETATAEGAVGANVEAESVDMAARSPALPSYGDTAPPPAAAKEKEPVSNEGRDDTDTGESNQGQGAGAAASGAAVDGASAGEEPAVSWQFDADVMRAQTLLAQIGLYRGAIDGLLGDRTLAAIHDFQRGLSMPETGELSDSLLVALEEQVAAASSEAPAKEQLQGHYDAVVDAAENLQIIDIMSECRGKDAEWVYIAAINRHVLCGGLSAETPNPLPTR